MTSLIILHHANLSSQLLKLCLHHPHLLTKIMFLMKSWSDFILRVICAVPHHGLCKITNDDKPESRPVESLGRQLSNLSGHHAPHAGDRALVYDHAQAGCYDAAMPVVYRPSVCLVVAPPGFPDINGKHFRVGKGSTKATIASHF